MPIGVLEMNPAKPHAAQSTAPLSRGFAGYLLLGNSLAEPLFWLLRKLFHGELPQIGSPGCMGLMIPAGRGHICIIRNGATCEGTEGGGHAGFFLTLCQRWSGVRLSWPKVFGAL